MKQRMKVVWMLMLVLVSPSLAFAQNDSGGLGGIFNAIEGALAPVWENRGTIMMIVAVIGLIIAVIAWGSDATSQSPVLTKVVKGAFLVLVVIEAFLWLGAPDGN